MRLASGSLVSFLRYSNRFLAGAAVQWMASRNSDRPFWLPVVSPMSSSSLISVVIPAINESERIANAIEYAWNFGADQVIVVDGGSTDGTCQIAAQKDCQLLSSTPGRGIQQNIGAGAADGETLLFLHADSFLPPQAYQPLQQALSNPSVVWGGFRQRIDEPGKRYRWLEKGNASRVKWRGQVYGDQGIFIRRDVFQKIGGFAEFPLMEDVHLSDKMKKIARPVLLEGPLHIDARRWKANGVIRQTIRNWTFLGLYRLGVSPERLAQRYRRHDQI